MFLNQLIGRTARLIWSSHTRIHGGPVCAVLKWACARRREWMLWISEIHRVGCSCWPNNKSLFSIPRVHLFFPPFPFKSIRRYPPQTSLTTNVINPGLRILGSTDHMPDRKISGRGQILVYIPVEPSFFLAFYRIVVFVPKRWSVHLIYARVSSTTLMHLSSVYYTLPLTLTFVVFPSGQMEKAVALPCLPCNYRA